LKNEIGEKVPIKETSESKKKITTKRIRKKFDRKKTQGR
jgi:hypothetical protein